MPRYRLSIHARLRYRWAPALRRALHRLALRLRLTLIHLRTAEAAITAADLATAKRQVEWQIHHAQQRLETLAQAEIACRVKLTASLDVPHQLLRAQP